ncbi:MAG TPA: UbiA family prenyltransferase [Dehalococcoidia bacterium]|nr:UbiA family prenyltransferase [Dehalococcoidia bacterium]
MDTVRLARGAGFGQRWLLRARLIHPFPTALNVAATIVLAFIAGEGEPPLGIVLRMALVMLLIQSAIGATNDYCDRWLDALSKPGKPLAAGVLSPGTALLIAGIAITLAALIATTLGPLSWLLAMLGLGLGLLYNFWLKRTLLSALPYLIAIPLLPVWVWTTVGSHTAGIFWLLPLGALTGLGLHLANALVDFESDGMGGAYGLAHRLGRRRTLLLAWGSPAAALVLAGALTPVVVARPDRALAGIVAGLLLLLLGLGLYGVKPGQQALRLNFGLLALATAVSGAGWLAAL